MTCDIFFFEKQASAVTSVYFVMQPKQEGS